MLGSLPRGEHAIADKASPSATDDNKDFPYDFDLRLFH
jgi:hypothetical protein